MAVNKLDPKIIFASEAPAQDTPAVFNNRTLGWGESRKNGGRPTIKQMNALQQDTELKILWLNENAVTPFDATIDYPLNAVTIKDGQFKIFNGTSWSLFLDKSSVGLNNVDNTSDLNKPISTAVKVKLDYIDNNGAALPYKEGITYEENAVVVKDGVLQQWKGGMWVLIKPEHNDLTGRDVAGTHPASAILDVSGKDQQEITSLLANNNLVYRGAKNNQSADISDLFESVVNSLRDGDTLVIPEGNYYWDTSTGTKVITKNINIDCRGTIHVKPTANAFLRFRTNDFVRGSATTYLSAVSKNDAKLNVIGTPLVNPHEYYVIIESTETLIYRAGFSQPYQKYVISDIISSDYDLRDPIPFGYDDLSKATVTFIKKQAPTKISGLKFKPTIEIANAKYLNLDYVSNTTFEDCLADVQGKASAGIVIEYSNCLNLDFIKCGINGQNKAGVDSYAFTIWNSAYINYEKCFNYTSGLSNKSGRLHSGRHGRNVTIDGCLCNGVDDHWGYDYLVKNTNFGQTKETYGSIGFAGGSLTIEKCSSPDNLVYLRTDTPYADGTLKISGSTAKKSLLFARGHEPSITTFAPQKFWDVIDIDIGVVDFTKSTEPTIIFKEPNVAQTDVYRETILYIRNATRILNKVAGKSLLNIWLQDKADYTGEIPAFEGDYEKKRLFSKVFIENIDTTTIDDASVTSRQYLIQAPVCKELNVSHTNDFAFANVRCPVFNISNVKTGDSKSGGGSHSLDVGELNATNVCEQSGAKGWWFREVLYTTPKVYFYTSRFATRDGFISKFGNRLQASVGMVFDDVSVSSNTSADYRSRNNFVRNMTAKYTFTEAVTIAANENSSEFEVDFPTVQRADIVLAEFDLWNEYIQIDVYKKNVNGKVYFRLKNSHTTLSKTVDIGRSINFITI